MVGNTTPCASGASREKLIVHALHLTYCFHASPPDSRPLHEPSGKMVCYKEIGIVVPSRTLVSSEGSANLGTACANVELRA